MKGFLVLLDQVGLDNLRDEQQHALGAIRANVDRLDVMISNLLMLTECHDGAYKPILEPVRFADFLEEFLEMRDLAKLGRNPEIDLQESVGDTKVLLDRQRFPLVLTNLLDNAFKFAREATEPRVVLRARREGPRLVLEVHDDGIGILEGLGERVFDRFTQADMSSTREHQGAGLGLAVVRELVSAHEGTARLVPPVMGGTSVRVSLPVVGE
jgi:signal transduction histidine kinase